MDYRSLTTSSTRSFRGKTIFLSSPERIIDQAEAPGRIDGALVRVLANRSRKHVIVTAETTAEPRSREFSDPPDFSRWILQTLASRPSADAWLNELLLELLYERYICLAEIRGLVANSVWWQAGSREPTSVLEALRNLAKTGLVSAEKGRYYTSTSLGRLVVERGLPISSSDIRGLQEQLEEEREVEVREDELVRERLRYFEELVHGLIEADGWTTVTGVAHEAARMHVTTRASRGIARRLLEKMVARPVDLPTR